MSVTAWMVIAIVLYTGLNLYVGLGLGYKKEITSSASGYFLGGGINYFVLYFTTAATWFSTWIYMGAAGAFYKSGISFVCAITWQLVILFLMGYFGVKFWKLGKKFDYITPGDLLADYYESKALRYVVAIIQLAFCIPYIMAQITGVGLAFMVLTNGAVPYWGGVFYAAIVVGFYVYVGGFRSQAWVDTMQGIMFTIILWGAVVILFLRPEINGMHGLFDAVFKKDMSLLTYPGFSDGKYWVWSIYISFFFIQSFGGFFAPYVWQRMYAAKNVHIITKMAGTLAPFYAFAIMAPVLLIGLGGSVLMPELANPDNVLVATMTKYNPYWGVLVVIGILAAGMSTISSILVTASSIISVDLIKQHKKDMSTKQLSVTGQRIVLLILLIAVCMSLMQIKGIIFLVFMALSGFAQFFFPAFGVLFWKKATKEGCIAGLIVAVSLMTRPVSTETQQKFKTVTG
jgi:SSS family solute:Na+ symporter